MSESTAASKTATPRAKKKLVGKDISTVRRVSRSRRHFRLRKKIIGTLERPRLVVTRSSRHMVAQVIDDIAGHTMASASTMESDIRAMEGDKKARAARVGEMVAARARDAGISQVVFDRGGHHYHGRIAALADAVREAGLEF